MLTLASLARADHHMLLNAGNDVQRWWRLVYTVLTGETKLETKQPSSYSSLFAIGSYGACSTSSSSSSSSSITITMMMMIMIILKTILSPIRFGYNCWHCILHIFVLLLLLLLLLNKCIEDDTKAAARQSLNSIKNNKCVSRTSHST